MDRQFQPLGAWETQIMPDSVQPEAEQALLDLLVNVELPYFHFAKLLSVVHSHKLLGRLP